MRLKIVRSKNRACGCEPGFYKYNYLGLRNFIMFVHNFTPTFMSA